MDNEAKKKLDNELKDYFYSSADLNMVYNNFTSYLNDLKEFAASCSEEFTNQDEKKALDELNKQMNEHEALNKELELLKSRINDCKSNSKDTKSNPTDCVAKTEPKNAIEKPNEAKNKEDKNKEVKVQQILHAAKEENPKLVEKHTKTESEPPFQLIIRLKKFLKENSIPNYRFEEYFSKLLECSHSTVHHNMAVMTKMRLAPKRRAMYNFYCSLITIVDDPVERQKVIDQASKRKPRSMTMPSMEVEGVLQSQSANTASNEDDENDENMSFEECEGDDLLEETYQW